MPKVRNKSTIETKLIGRNLLVGEYCIIKPNVNDGKNALISAGSVVIKNTKEILKSCVVPANHVKFLSAVKK